MTTTRRQFNRTLAAAPLAATGLFGARLARAQEAQVLRFNLFTPKTHFYHRRILEPWAANIEKATAGRVKIEFTTAPLGPMTRAVEIAKNGIADIAAGNHGVIPGRFPLTQITEIPFVQPTTPEAMSVALWRTNEKYLAKLNEHEGAHVLALHTSGSMHLFSREKPLRSAADLKGRKILVPNTTGSQWATNMGAVPVLKAVTEYYDAISKGVVDAVMATNTSIAGWRAEDLIKHQTRIPGATLYGTFFVVANAEKWNAISAADRAAIMGLSGEAYARTAGRVFVDEDEKSFQARTAGRIQVEEASPAFRAEIAKGFDFVESAWLAKAKAAGIDGPAVVKSFRDEVNGYKG